MSSAADSQLSFSLRKDLLVLMRALEIFAGEQRSMSLQQIMTFVLVALYEAKSVGEYRRQTETDPAVMARHLLDVGAGGRRKGLGVVTYRQHPLKEREHQYFLSEKGRALIQSLALPPN